MTSMIFDFISFLTKLLILGAFIYWCASCAVSLNKSNTCVDLKVITEIGGCNKYSCGVRYADGSFGNESTPVVGETVCTNLDFEFKWRWL